MSTTPKNKTRNGVYVIAEAGVNHNGSLDTALELIDAAADSGADAIKFQTFRAEALVVSDAPKASYQNKQVGKTQSHFEMLKALELKPKNHAPLFRKCQERGIEFMSTAFDEESLKFLVNDIGVKRLKAPSGELTNGPLLLRMSQTGLPIILSTGMATLNEIGDALAVIAFGYLGNEEPKQSNFLKTYQSIEAKKELYDKVTLLHCTTQYPTPIEDVNLSAMNTLNEQFGLRVGYSDHTLGTTIPIAAVAMGAEIIEKHFTLDRGMPGPDHAASLEPVELSEMVSNIRAVEVAIGDGVKKPAPSEKENINIARRSLVALCSIKKGDIFNAENLGSRRPETGMSPMTYWDVLGTSARRHYMAEELIEE